MTRLQTKCLIGSALFHGLTVVVFLATAAFRSAPTVTGDQVLNLIPAKILDDPGFGGQPAPAPVKPQPYPPAIQPAPPKPPSQPAPVAPPAPPKPPPQPAPAAPPKTVAATTSRQPDVKPAAARPGPSPTPVRRGIKVTLDPVTPSTGATSRNSDSAAQAWAAEQAANHKRVQEEFAAAFAALDSSVRSKETPVNVVALPGEGGGEAFVNYGTAVCSVYYNAWRPEVTSRRLTVPVAQIVVSRNGSVTSSELVTKSGDPLLDRSVQRALDAVKELPPFPPNATDTERSFIIRFNPEAKQSAG